VLLERLLKSEEPIDMARFLEYARRKTAEYCGAKKFVEQYYHTLERIPVGEIEASVVRSLTNLVSSERFRRIVRKAVANKTGWVIEPPGFGATRINGMKAYCKVDFLFPVEGALHILDWKTGKADERKHRKQLIGYTTWAAYHFGTGTEHIFPSVAYLQPEYRETAVTVTATDVQEFTEAVSTESKAMYAYCKNVEQNIPRNKEEFARTSNARVCGFCNYRELCGVK
jgi:hypothetical protein